jgi:thioredoxin-like negative regulator of GroEL
MGTLLKKEKRYPEAEATFRQALAERQRSLGADHPDTASSAYSLASVLALEGKRDDAISRLKFAVEHDLSAEERSGLATDADLNALRGDPRLDAILATSSQKAALASK